MRCPAKDLDGRTQALLAALAAIELQNRLVRTLPVTVLDHHAPDTLAPWTVPAIIGPDQHAASPAPLADTWPVHRAGAGATHRAAPPPVAWHWSSWPAEAMQHLCARDALSLLARTRQPHEPVQALCVDLVAQPTPATQPGPAAVRLWCRPGGEMLSVICQCRHDDPWAPAAAAIAEMYAEIFHALITQPDIKVAQAPGTGRTSLRLVLAPPAPALLHTGPFRAIPQLIEDWADQTPDRVALQCGEQSLDYRRFDRLANAWAARLAARSVARGALVPVLLAGGLEVPLAWQALMKLGAAFVPLDVRWPVAQLEQALQLLDAGVVICAAAADLPAAWRSRALPLATDALPPVAQRPCRAPASGDLIHGFFTTPSAGPRMRCALHHHGGQANGLRFMSRYFRCQPGSHRVLQTARPCHHAAFWQIMWPLTAGGTVVLPAPASPPAGAGAGVVDAVAGHGISLIALGPEQLGQLADTLLRDAGTPQRLAGLREVIIGSEAVSPQAVTALCDALPWLRITRMHDAPDASIGAIFQPVQSAGDAVVVRGRPIDNCQVLVVDHALRPLPPGASGDLLIGGACVGSGYLHDAAATAQVFIDNPFPTLPGTRLYRTGLRGRLDDRGHLVVI